MLTIFQLKSMCLSNHQDVQYEYLTILYTSIIYSKTGILKEFQVLFNDIN